MNVSQSAETVWALAGKEAQAHGFETISPEHFLVAMARLARLNTNAMRQSDQPGTEPAIVEIEELQALFARAGLDPDDVEDRLGRALGHGPGRKAKRAVLHRDEQARLAINQALQLAIDDRSDQLRAAHILRAILANPTERLRRALSLDGPVCLAPPPAENAEPPGSAEPPDPARLDELIERIRAMRTALRGRIFGQDHAIETFLQGLFNAEVLAAADTERRGPRSHFVFAGPPGVGKTFLAETGAARLGRPFQRFDMSAYARGHQGDVLVGMPKGYHNAQPGQLTGFVQAHPDAVLLFDEIEKAHRDTIHLFLQILDAGRLDDKFTEQTVAFRDTTIIFTTNVGRQLYDQPNASGIHTANASFSRQSVIDALRSETNPATGEPFFPEALCSRMATGYPVLFNELGVADQQRVAGDALERTAGLIETQYGLSVGVDPAVAQCLVLREGGRGDARTLRSQCETFLKTELMRLARLYQPQRLRDVLDRAAKLHVTLEPTPDQMSEPVRVLFESSGKPVVLLVADEPLGELYASTIDQFDWRCAAGAEQVADILAENRVDLVLLDLWLDRPRLDHDDSIIQFDHVPAAASRLRTGQSILQDLHRRHPSLPVYLLSLQDRDATGETGQVDEELFLACVQAGGARGVITSRFRDADSGDSELRRDELADQLADTCRRLHQQRSAEQLARQRKALVFDTVPRIEPQGVTITIRLRDLRLGRAIDAQDAGALVDDIERPAVRFDDVIGAESAKQELQFYIDYLKNPHRYAALGLRPPRGVLLYGPPGVGKTLLGRALAGESEMAFLAASATNFVTKYVGSGPQAVRELFARARRYAPAVIFIDEIDAIGQQRRGDGFNRAEENTLNALLTEMDGFTQQSADQPIFILAATNFSIDGEPGPTGTHRKLDGALVRRFSRSILVDLPDRRARREYLDHRLTGRQRGAISEAGLSLLAERSAGMSLATLDAVVDAACRLAACAAEPLSDTLLAEAFELTRFGQAQPRSPQQVHRTAIHEAGHTLLYWLAGRCPSYVTVVSRGRHGGYMARSSDEIEEGLMTRPQLLGSLRMLLAGRAAEQMHFGPEEGLSTGVGGDLSSATELATRMVTRYGMDEQFGLLCPPDSQAMTGQVEQAVRQLLDEQLAEARRLLDRYRQPYDRLVAELAEKERLTGEQVRQLLGEVPNGTTRDGE